MDRHQLLAFNASHRGLLTLVIALWLVLSVSACGGPAHSAHGTAVGGQTAPSPLGTASSLPGSLPGSQVFADAGCAICHTLAAAGAAGYVGPNLDHLKPSVAAVIKQVTTGGDGMPSFAARLSPRNIRAVAQFVAAASRRDKG
jgi:mono/diheme cytochrome c family protein